MKLGWVCHRKGSTGVSGGGCTLVCLINISKIGFPSPLVNNYPIGSGLVALVTI